jgi:hypothetical protein
VILDSSQVGGGEDYETIAAGECAIRAVKRGVNTVSLPGPGDPAFRESLRLLSGVAWALEMLDLTAKQCNQSPASSVNVGRLVDNSRRSKNKAAPECDLKRGMTEG